LAAGPTGGAHSGLPGPRPLGSRERASKGRGGVREEEEEGKG